MPNLTTSSAVDTLLSASDQAGIRTAAGLGTLATQSGTFSGTSSGTNTGDQSLAAYATTAAVASGYQPLDSDLTAIAALTTTTFGRAVLTLADAAALRTAAGLGTLATQSGTFSGTSSGTNTGDQTTVTGNAGTVTTINGRISAGSNVTFTGTGTAADPYVISSSGGGGSSLTVADLAAGTALAVNYAYFDTVSANRTFDALPAGTDGDRISLTFDVTGATRTLNFHTNSTVYRAGESGALAAAISFPVGNHELSLRKADGKWYLLDTGTVAPKIVTKHSSAAYTVGTTDPNELFGGQIFVTSTGTQSLPAIAEGNSLTIIADAAVVVTIDPNGSEVIRLNGVDLTAGYAIKSSGAIGEMVVLTYHGAGKWYAATAEFITNGS